MLRNASTDDATQIAQIHRIARSKAMPWLPVVHTPDEDLAFFSQEVLQKESVRVVVVDGKIVGFIAFFVDWLNHLYIHPDYWAKGFGTALLEEAKASSAMLQLWTFQRNSGARAFYSAHGFEEVELTDGTGNEERTPDVRMVWNPADHSSSNVGSDTD